MYENYKEGDYTPGKGFYHLCKYPNCTDKSFFGRKNKKYHSDCKKKMDAARYALKREKTKKENQIMFKNLSILEDLYPKSIGYNEIPAKELLLKGFDPKAPSRRIKTEINGYDCHIIHGYAYRYIKKNDTIIIYKENELHRI